MGRYKCAYNCENSSDSEVKCFKFPLYNPRKLKKWLTNMKWPDWTPTRFSVLCIHHFEERFIDRTGKAVTLREDAVPTLFSASTHRQQTSTSSTRTRNKQPAARAARKDPVVPSAPSAAPQEPPADPKKSDKWRIIVDEGLMKIKSFPHFFHGDYCAPHNIQWAPDGNVNAEHKDPENLIQMEEAWQWLGLDVRGPLPQTLNGHRYVLTLTDLHSRWVEAAPMQSCLPPDVAKNVADVIAHFGFPLRILSRLPHDVVHKINRELKDQLKVSVPLVVYHQQTGTADAITPQMIDRMVGDLVDQHAADWDVYLPAQVFSLCFKEHPETKQRPFTALCCRGLQPVQAPRGLDYTYSQIQESVFVIR